MVGLEPPVREPRGVVVQQASAARLVMSPGGAGRTVGGGTEISSLNKEWETPGNMPVFSK